MNKHAATTLTITRTFAAPRRDVFAAWTNVNSEAGWWGPKGFAPLFDEKDLKSGGRWRMGMVRNGETTVSGGVYRDIVPPERLVMTHAWEDADGKLELPETLVTITFDERDDKTAMVFVQSGFEDADSLDGHRKGWNEAFDVLADAFVPQKARST